MQVKKYTLEFDINTYVVIENNHYFVVDPGYGFDTVNNQLQESGYILDFVLLTHLHFDHTFGLARLNTKTYISKYAKDNIYNGDVTLYNMLDIEIPYKEVDFIYLDLDSSLSFFEHKIKVFFTPGHTKDSVCYLLDSQYLFSGDTLFKEGVGRTDLPTGNEKELYKSLQLFKHFSNSITVLPGHGDKTTIKDELNNNSFLK